MQECAWRHLLCVARQSNICMPVFVRQMAHPSLLCVGFAGKVLSRDLTQQLNNAIQFLVHCRPLSISMGNAIKYVKLQASLLSSTCPNIL